MCVVFKIIESFELNYIVWWPEGIEIRMRHPSCVSIQFLYMYGFFLFSSKLELL